MPPSSMTCEPCRYFALEEATKSKGDWGKAKEWEIRTQTTETLAGADPV